MAAWLVLVPSCRALRHRERAHLRAQLDRLQGQALLRSCELATAARQLGYVPGP